MSTPEESRPGPSPERRAEAAEARARIHGGANKSSLTAVREGFSKGFEGYLERSFDRTLRSNLDQHGIARHNNVGPTYDGRPGHSVPAGPKSK